MNWNFENVLDIISKTDSKLLLKGKWGIERESQRVTENGCLALTEHPAAFGNKISNSEITTDFSESQIELITPPFPSVEEAYNYLKILTLKVNNELKNEYLWPLSMPPKLPSEELIPIAKFDDTPEGKEKEIYRLGLAHRYGKKMQLISGIHFNLSFSEELFDVLYKYFGNIEDRIKFTDKVYFTMARNFLRYRWLLIYLFGASPNSHHTFNSVINNEIKSLKKCYPECCNYIDNYKKYAVSLRVSRLGYSNDEQNKFGVSYNDKYEYLQSIRTMLSTKSEKYSKIGIIKEGKQIQLNDNILQKENEFYSPIRLKQATEKGESQLDAIEKRGVSYAEVRIIDINPFESIGISLEQLHFLQVFILFCLFESNEFINQKELDLINKNHNLVAISGRRTKLQLYQYTDGQVLLEDWGQIIFNKLFQLAEVLDAAVDSNKYMACVITQSQKLKDKSLLPSNKIVNEIKAMGESYISFGIRKALEYKKQCN
ncbi:glutamate--cysteine ligase [Ruminiclostridium herbifermentans]|uniref:Glutamate--cysteine ligase n=1 Tax=Ruminiclostridium herbifermentans TaxID=2488810 RepID=A0A4U7JKT7_9FIRM|nr:glutamate--cysteine ligase [Ruminiclostridium herbifermentans]QNU68651.1 glutamate--cysteine ligase [Ruminiclostridium herbifermentans]